MSVEPPLRRVANVATVLAAVLFVLTLLARNPPEPVRATFALHASASARLHIDVTEVDQLEVAVELPRNDVVRLSSGFLFSWVVSEGDRIVSSSPEPTAGMETVASRSTRMLVLGHAPVQDGRGYDVTLQVVALPPGAEGVEAALRVGPDPGALKGWLRVGQVLFQVMTVSIVVAALASILARRPSRKAAR